MRPRTRHAAVTRTPHECVTLALPNNTARASTMSPERSQAESELRQPELYVNRELSWLAFNERVLDQACDSSWPLLERIKFLAIFGSNLDEFFMIRVSGLHELLDAKAPSTAPDGLSAIEQ